MRFFQRCRRLATSQDGFTLIEMIGVLAIIAILVAAITPRIFEAIADSRVSNFAAEVKAVQTAVSKYYSDVGTLFPLVKADGTDIADDEATATLFPDILMGKPAAIGASTDGLWARYRGPYIENLSISTSPIGATMVIAASLGLTAAAEVATTSTSYDLNNDGVGDFITANNSQIVSMVLTGVSERE